MKRVFATLLLMVGGTTLPLPAWSQAPTPPADLYESPDQGPSPTPLKELSPGEPTPLTPEEGAPTPTDEPTPVGKAPAPQSEPATPAPPATKPIPLSDTKQPKPLPQSSSSKAPAPIPRNDAIKPTTPPQANSPAPNSSTTTPEALPEDEAAASKGKADDVPTEVVTERYPNRMIKIERHVTQDAERNFINHGPWIMYAQDGTLIAKGRFEMGRRQGEWQRLYDSKDERIVGKTGKAFSPPFVGIAQFTDDKLHGTWKIVDAQQREIRTWEFSHGRLTGTAVTYFPNGKKQSEMTFADGTLSGSTIEWDSTGNVAKKTDFKDGRTTTPYLKKYPSGAKQHEGQYLGPNKLVKSSADFWTGIVDLQTVKTDAKPKRHGQWTEYFEHGAKKFEGEFDEDQPIGLHTWWYPNGQKMAEGAFETGKANGHWVWWHDNGQKQKDGGFDHGVQSGTWVHWKADGKVQEVQEHSLSTISPQQAKPLVNSGEPRQEQPTEAIQTEEAPVKASPQPLRQLSPAPMPQQQRTQAPMPQQQRAETPMRFRSR